MMFKYLFFISALLATLCLFEAEAGPACIFNGADVKCLKDNLKFKSTSTKIITGDTDDPTSVAKSADESSLYLRDGTGEVYLKTDSGSSTNWILINGDVIGPSITGASDNAIARWDTTTGRLLQNSNVFIDDDGRIDQTGLGSSVIIGTNAGANDDLSSNEIVAVGLNAATAVTTGQRTVAVGSGACSTITTGQNNTCIGHSAGSGIPAGISNNVALGRATLAGSVGADNVAIGNGAITINTAGTKNVAIGTSALSGGAGAANSSNLGIGFQAGLAITSGEHNVFLGRNAGDSTTTGDDNVYIGSLSAANATTGSGNILIGKSVDTSSATSSNELNIGNMIYGDVTTGIVSTTNIFSAGQMATGSLPTASAWEGYLAYDTTTQTYKYSDGSTWASIGGSSASSTINAAWGGTQAIVVGSAADVVADNATHSTIASAIADASVGDRITLLARTWTENITVSGTLTFVGSGYNSVISGTVDFEDAADGSSMERLRVIQDITLESGVQNVNIHDIYIISSTTIYEASANESYVHDVIQED